MAGFMPNEGDSFVANLIFKNITADRGTGLQLLLFTNATVDATTTAATLTEPTGTGYARIALVDATWTEANGIASYPKQTFTGGVGGWTGSVYGHAVVTTGTTPRILAIEVDPNGPYVIAENDNYDVTLNITVA